MEQQKLSLVCCALTITLEVTVRFKFSRKLDSGMLFPIWYPCREEKQLTAQLKQWLDAELSSLDLSSLRMKMGGSIKLSGVEVRVFLIVCFSKRLYCNPRLDWLDRTLSVHATQFSSDSHAFSNLRKVSRLLESQIIVLVQWWRPSSGARVQILVSW